jgi:hypothetical protein
MKRGVVLCLIFFLLSGCLPRQDTSGIVDSDKIATFVAATQTGEVTPGVEPVLPTDTSAPDQEQTPQSQATATETPTPTLTSTPTLTLTPTITASPTQFSGDPVLSLGAPTFQDNFKDGSNFYLYDETQSSFQVDDNRMVLVAKKANSYETWTLSWGDIKNFYLEISGAFGDTCSGKDRYGMIFRAPDTSQGYLISIACDGSYRLSTWESDLEEYTTIKKWTSSEYANSGPGAVNRLGIKTKDSQLTGFINGHQVFELNDSTFNKGRFGILVAASDTAGFTAYLTKAVYWKLP